MDFRRVLAAAACATFVALGSSAFAEEYRAGEVFNLDLSKAVLSPKRFGPPSEFAPVAVEARTDAKQAVAEPKAEHKSEPKADHQRVIRTTRVAAPHVTAPQTTTAHVTTAHVTANNVSATHVAKPRGAARAKLAHRHSNPLDAQAMDKRVQTWPCRSGGICNWR
jgi:hypothetical protein